jgi:hypothetical protein
MSGKGSVTHGIGRIDATKSGYVYNNGQTTEALTDWITGITA